MPDNITVMPLPPYAGDTVDVLSAFPHAAPIVDAPFGYSPNSVGNYATPPVKIGHYLGTLNVFPPQQVALKIRELQEDHREFLLTAEYSAQCHSEPHDIKVAIRFIFPVSVCGLGSASRKHRDASLPLYRPNYRLLDPPTIERRDYGLWEPKG